MNQLNTKTIVICAIVAVAILLTSHYAVAQDRNRLPSDLRLVDQFQPVFANGSCDSDGQMNNCQTQLYTVPSGKRLVLEYFSGVANLPFAGQQARMLLNISPSPSPSGATADIFVSLLPPAAQNTFVGNLGGISSIGQTVRIYAAPLSIVRASALRSNGDGHSVFYFTINGHLENVGP